MAKLLYELEYNVNELREQQLNKIEYNIMSVRDLLDLGFDNCFIKIEDNWFNLGYKWYNMQHKMWGYESNDFGELKKEQLNSLVKFVDSEISDYNYLQVSVELVNEKDKKYFE